MAKEWNLPPRARKGPIADIQSVHEKIPPRADAQNTAHTPRCIDMVLTEWLMLQCCCDQAQRELMGVICKLLEENDNTGTS